MLIWTYNNIIIKFKSNKIYIRNPILNLVKNPKNTVEKTKGVIYCITFLIIITWTIRIIKN